MENIKKYLNPGGKILWLVEPGQLLLGCRKGMPGSGRAVGDVLINDMSLTKILLAKNYAHKYDGKTKQPWTDEELQYILDH